jgi:hypothetical protein
MTGKADIEMKQLADVKMLLPTITAALGDRGGFTLNMIGPIYFGTIPDSETSSRLQVPNEIEVSTDDLFAEDVTMLEFKEKVIGVYFRIFAARHHFDRDEIKKGLKISDVTMGRYCKLYGVEMQHKKRGRRPGRLLLQEGRE